MERKLLSSYDSDEQSECSCCYEDSDYSDCSCSDCDCDSTCSSCYDSPKLVYTNSKLNNKVLKQLQYIEELSKSCDNSGDHVLVYNFKDQSKKNIKLHTSSKESYGGSNDESGSSHNLSTLPSLHSKQLQQELLEIENLLCETSLGSNTDANDKFTDSYNSLHSDSNSQLNSSDVHTPVEKSYIDGHGSNGTGIATSGSDVNSFPSGFNTPNYRFSDADYNDLDKLYSMLVSLDLYSYMFVVENVLDQRMKRELSQVKVMA
ncbi:hypothetical protein MACK_002731 [Theileria orientalis]|uniref:Uncharacterized protein n=1 Tax=Theileria orientalis TaxID=68886 RepID=A0A976MDX1_THEOR|nr:hypothetical protein MACK_002731 [Theileria orientalis]